LKTSANFVLQLNPLNRKHQKLLKAKSTNLLKEMEKCESVEFAGVKWRDRSENETSN